MSKMSLKEKYARVIVSEMKEKFSFRNNMEVPKIEKVIVNVGIGKFIKDSSQVEEIKNSVAMITGQKPLMTKARKSIAGFKLREGMEVGIKVTLRGRRKWDFLEKLINASIPRVRDFHGIKKSAVDSNGNLNLGIKEHMIFPEILPEQVKNIFSLQINVKTTAGSKEEGLELFRLLGIPFESEEK